MNTIGVYQTTANYTIIQVLAPFNLHTIKGNGRQACCRATCRDSQTSVDLRRLPDWCSAYETVQSTTQRLQRLSSFRTLPQEDLQDRTTSPTLSCSCFVADSYDHLEFLQTWLSAAGTITFTLFDAPLHESSAANSTIFASVGRR